MRHVRVMNDNEPTEVCPPQPVHTVVMEPTSRTIRNVVPFLPIEYIIVGGNVLVLCDPLLSAMGVQGRPVKNHKVIGNYEQWVAYEREGQVRTGKAVDLWKLGFWLRQIDRRELSRVSLGVIDSLRERAGMAIAADAFVGHGDALLSQASEMKRLCAFWQAKADQAIRAEQQAKDEVRLLRQEVDGLKRDLDFERSRDKSAALSISRSSKEDARERLVVRRFFREVDSKSIQKIYPAYGGMSATELHLVLIQWLAGHEDATLRGHRPLSVVRFGRMLAKMPFLVFRRSGGRPRYEAAFDFDMDRRCA